MLTKKDRQLLLEDFRTIFLTKAEFKTEMKKEIAHLVTKKELKEEVKKQIAHLVTKEELNAKIAGLVTKEEFISRFDALMYELKAIREEIAVFGYRQAIHSDQIDSQDTRLKRVELKVGLES